MNKRGGFFVSNWAYIVWFVLYFIITWVLLGGTGGAFAISLCIYAVSIGLALSPAGEGLFRKTSGIRPLVLKEEIDLLQPLFNEVYEDAKRQNPELKGNIKLYIQDTMEVNACAVGRTTVAVTKGAIQFMDDEELRGLLAHEMGHLANGDTKALLMTSIGNGIFNICVILGRILIRLVKSIAYAVDGGPLYLTFWTIGGAIELVTFLFIVLGEIILMFNSRRNEYLADRYAYNIGYGDSLRSALVKLQSVSTTEKRSIMNLLKATHPNLIDRIMKLDKMGGVESIEEVIT